MSQAFLLDEPQALEALLERYAERAPAGWRPHRILFRNFWLFRREEFLWHHGRVFLGGGNRTGKSTVLSMAVPVLLDGEKGDDRLQTFGGRGRHMAYYMTGVRPGDADDGAEGPEAYHHTARTSYMALEFRRRHTEAGEPEYRTFGQGMRHDRDGADKSVRSWGFEITDGRRLGRSYDGVPFDVVRGQVSLERGELKRLLGDGGRVFDTNLEYRKAVNRALFGFADLEDFDALIELLLELRSPGLANTCRPGRVASILSEALPPISESVTRSTADTLDNIDQTTGRIEATSRHIEAARVLDRATAAVYRRAAEIAAARLLRDAAAAEEASQALGLTRAQLDSARRQREEAARALAEGDRQATALQAEQEELQAADAYRAAAERTRLEGDLRARSERHAVAERALRRDAQAQDQRRRALRRKEDRWNAERRGALEDTRGLADLGRTARWEAPAEWAESLEALWHGLRLETCGEEVPLAVPRARAEEETRARVSSIGAVRRLVEERAAAADRYTQAQAAERLARDRYLDADNRRTQSQVRVAETKEAAAAAVREWAGQLTALILPEGLPGDVAASLLAFDHTGSAAVGTLLEPVRQAADAAGQRVRDAIAQARAAIAAAEASLAGLRADRRALDQAPPEPPRTDEQRRGREVLAAAGIPFAPLYETLDFAAGVEPASAAWTEEALGQMGLLDALAVEPARRDEALAALRDSGCGERLLAGAGAASAAGLTDSLVPDPEHPLAAAALLALAPGEGRAVALGDRTWRHGVLEGTAATPSAPRFIGRTARERHRLAEIARLDGEIAALRAGIAARRDEVEGAERRLEAMTDERSTLERHAAFVDVEAARHAVAATRAEFERESAHFERARGQTEQRRGALDAAGVALDAEYRGFPAARGLDRQGLDDLRQATVAARDQVALLHRRAEALHRSAAEALETRTEIERAEQGLRERQAEIAALQGEVDGLRGRLEAIARLLSTPDAQSLFARVEGIRGELTELARRRDERVGAEAAARSLIDHLRPQVPGLSARATETERRAEASTAALRTAAGAYPTLREAAEAAGADPAGAAAALVARFSDRTDLAAHIENLHREASAQLGGAFAEQRQVLEPAFRLEYRPSDAAALVICVVDGTALPPCNLLTHLERQREELRRVLERHEVDLFERHLLREAGQEVRRCMTRARDWVGDTCDLLAQHPMNDGTTVELQWEAKGSEYEAGGIIAKRAHLLWKEESSLTVPERDLLRQAFREEIRQVREQAKQGEWRQEAFRQRLAEVLDYRSWFQFRLFVRGGIAARRRELTDQVWAAGSGSERSMHVLLPLFAALVSRYKSARADAPRLLALDEAFAGLDAVNVRQLIRVLTAFGFTWICTSDKVPRLTQDLPGASMYVMLRTGLDATARTMIWDGRRVIEVGA